MKLVKNFVFAVLLVSTLAVNTMAGGGETQLPGFVPPPPPPMTAENDEGQVIPVSGSDTQDTRDYASENLFYEALAALLSVY